MNDNILDMQKDFEIKALEDEIEKLKNTITKLEIILKESGVEYTATDVSDAEAICVQEISKLKKFSDDMDGGLTSDDIKKFDLLNKNLQLIRGNLKRGKTSNLKKMTVEQLKKQLKK